MSLWISSTCTHRCYGYRQRTGEHLREPNSDKGTGPESESTLKHVNKREKDTPSSE